MSQDTDSEPAPERLVRIEQEALSRVQVTREQLVSLLYVASWFVTAVREHARGSELEVVCVAAKRGDDLVYATVETREPVDTRIELLLREDQDGR